MTTPRYLALADGQLGIFDAKTANGLVRYRPETVAAVVDPVHAGKTTRDILGSPAAIPIVATIDEGLALEPTALVIGVSPPGGALPAAWRRAIAQCLTKGLDVVSGLHEFLSDDPEFRQLANQYGCKLIDLRRPPESLPIGHALAKTTRAKRILTVGTDCNLGKMTVSLEMWSAARKQGVDARFLATGQTGILIADSGIALDRIPGDFMAGCVEEMVVTNGDADYLFVEGQGSVLHPAFSGVTLALLHGSVPDYMILCTHAGRRIMRNQSEPIPPLASWIPLYESLATPLHPSKVVGIAVNCAGLSDQEADDAVAQASDETGLPAADVVRGSAEPLLAAIGIG